ncbi:MULTISPECIES: hypothetical protein [unclassified Prosthecochloris]|uniref:hypothetical protein n=1 Tax=unclassified Prosthecochloris TaxID=2632826 RepID=UPI00223CDA18|nr:MULTISPECIES: hypothetical protein [unclassified Prosthecochloris]UZJ36423.1 hypothetical protein OO005_06535 [Prosthecochloris sp. SCSIO W1103]UZJ42692.1 hypothetical protein OO006_07030 [Prosthecochloris sp. SCSIO W1101]
MKLLSFSGKACTVFLLILAFSVDNADAVVGGGQQSSSGTAKVTANVPQFIVLHYYSNLTLNFETPTSEALDQGDNTMAVSWEGAASGDELSTASLMDAKLELDGTKTTVKMPNVWAVRGFSKSGNAEVTVTIPSGGDELSNGESKIGMSNVKVNDGENSGSSIKTNLGGIAKSSATFGGIELDLDFSETSRSGSHAGGQYTITASTI